MVLAFALKPFPARADEALFGYTTTTDSLPEGKWEYQQWNTLRDGKAEGTYTAFDLRNGVGHGLNSAFQIEVYMNSTLLHTKNVPDPGNVQQTLSDQTQFGIDSFSAEAKYRFYSPYKDPFGLSVVFEPELGVRDPERGLDQTYQALNFRLIGQKDFSDDQWLLVSNLNLTPKWTVTSGVPQKAYLFEYLLSGSYRFAPDWFLGLEARNRREFAQQDFGSQTYSAYYIGPTLHYGAQSWWATLTLLPQIGGSPTGLGTDASGTPVQDGFRTLGKQEKFEARLKFGINFADRPMMLRLRDATLH